MIDWTSIIKYAPKLFAHLQSIDTIRLQLIDKLFNFNRLKTIGLNPCEVWHFRLRNVTLHRGSNQSILKWIEIRVSAHPFSLEIPFKLGFQSDWKSIDFRADCPSDWGPQFPTRRRLTIDFCPRFKISIEKIGVPELCQSDWIVNHRDLRDFTCGFFFNSGVRTYTLRRYNIQVRDIVNLKLARNRGTLVLTNLVV